MSRRSCFANGVLLLCLAVPAVLPAQAAKGAPPKDAPPPAVTYHGLVPGVSSAAEVREKLGAPAFEASWYAWKMLYPAAGKPLRFDALHIEGGGEKGKVGTIEAVSVPPGFETRDAVVSRLGPPEFHLTLPSAQELLDYSEKGVRFSVDAQGHVTGAAYFPHGQRRVHDGERRRVDLRHLRQGPQPRTASPPDPDLEVGTAEADLTPEPGMLRGEFMVHDRLKARCAVFARGGLKVAIVGADLFGMLKCEVDPMEARLKEHGIDHLVFAMSHNHAAPDTIGIYGFFPREHVALIEERVVGAVIEASRRLRRVTELVAAADDLALEGGRVPGLFRNARNPGIVDPQIAVIEARGEDHKPLVTIVNFACHVEGLSDGAKDISADFPGYLCERLRERRGGQPIFLNGALGGMVSGDTPARTHAEAQVAGERLAAEAERILGFAAPCAQAQFTVLRRRIEIPVTNARFHVFQKLNPNRRVWVEGRVASELKHLRLGEAEILTIPGELLPELSFEVLEAMSGFPRLITGLANDELGYLIPAYDFRADAYEESMSVSPAAGPLVKECALRLIAEAARGGR